jgi:3-oxoacyl-[acyl-carrier-protein] synthase II
VAVTGLGLVTPAGIGVAETWAFLMSARSAAAPITRFDTSALPVRFACEASDFHPTERLSGKDARRLDRATQLALAAAVAAVEDAGIALSPAGTGVVVGTSIGGWSTQTEQVSTMVQRGPGWVHPFSVPMLMPNAGAAHISIRLGCQGPSLCISTACASGAHALGEGARLIREGRAEVVVAGGYDATVIPFALAAFGRLGALSTRNDDPERASRPFDVDRDGFVMGEGAGFCVLERLDRAEERGAVISAVLEGYAANSDALHLTAPPEDGAGAAACIRLALADAGVDTSSVVHVNAHGTATRLNDAAEARALRDVFGAPPPVTSLKGAVGHLQGAAGAVEAIAACLSIREGVMPPTANCEHPDGELGLDVVCEPRPLPHGAVLSTSFAFGGHNAALVLVPPPGR